MKKILCVSVLALSLAACSEVPTGHRGVFVNYGKPTGMVAEGLHWYNPLTTNLEVMEVREKKWGSATQAYTRDVQQADVKFTLSYQLDPAKAMWVFQNVGTNEDWAAKLIPQVVEQSIKDVFGQSEAVKDAINNQGAMQQRILAEIRKRLKPRNVIVHGFELNDISFSDAFEAAVEQKQIAVETANAERNKTVAVEERARQTVIAANADAEAMKIKTQALAGNAKLVEYEAVQKWNGELPQNMYGSAPLPFVGAR